MVYIKLPAKIKTFLLKGERTRMLWDLMERFYGQGKTAFKLRNDINLYINSKGNNLDDRNIG